MFLSLSLLEALLEIINGIVAQGRGDYVRLVSFTSIRFVLGGRKLFRCLAADVRCMFICMLT